MNAPGIVPRTERLSHKDLEEGDRWGGDPADPHPKQEEGSGNPPLLGGGSGTPPSTG